ncbi:MAG: response regulator [Verrucomicrobiota bacterium]
MNVLVIEDIAIDAKIVSRLIDCIDLDYQVKGRATSLSEAEQLLEEGCYELILLDLGLPDSAGTQSVARLRKKIRGSNTILIVLTGDNSEEVGQSALELGAHDYLIKGTLTIDMLKRSILYANKRMIKERELVESNAELNEAMQKLKGAQDRLVQKERLEAVGQMASGIAHDFNNALAAIQANVELLLDSQKLKLSEEDTGKMLKNVLMMTSDASEVAKRLSRFSDDKKSDDSHIPIDINESIQEVFQVTRPRWKDQSLAEGRKISVTLNLDPAARILGSKSEIREMITNLLFNATDAIHRSGTINVSTTVKNDRVILEVSDDGIGMTAREAQKCFEPFFSTKKMSSDMTGGCGLGLSSVYGIVERHKAEISVRSKIDLGTVFRIDFPLTAKELCADSWSSDDARSEVARGRPIRVLLVEDEKKIRTAMQIYLNAVGMNFDFAGDGVEGITKFAKEKYDVVITDFSMPKMNGEKFIGCIRKYSQKIPIIMMTGYLDESKKRTLERQNVDLILHKPCKLSVLRNHIESLVQTQMTR